VSGAVEKKSNVDIASPVEALIKCRNSVTVKFQRHLVETGN